MDVDFTEVLAEVDKCAQAHEVRSLQLSSDSKTFPAMLALLCVAQLNHPADNIVARWARAACDASLPNTERFCRHFSSAGVHFYETRGAGTVLMGPTYDGRVVHDNVTPPLRRAMIAHFLKLLVARLIAAAGWTPGLSFGHILPPGEHGVRALPWEYLLPGGRTPTAVNPPFLPALAAAWPREVSHVGMVQSLAPRRVEAGGGGTFVPDATLRAQDIADLEDLPPCLGEIVAAGRRRKLGYHERILLTSCLAQVVADDNQLVEVWQGLDPHHGNRKDHIKNAKTAFKDRAKLHYGCAKMIRGEGGVKCPLVAQGERCTGCSPMLPENFLKRALLGRRGKKV